MSCEREEEALVALVLGMAESAADDDSDACSQLFPSLKFAFLRGFDGVLALECGLDDGAECVNAPPPPPPPPPAAAAGDVREGDP